MPAKTKSSMSGTSNGQDNQKFLPCAGLLVPRPMPYIPAAARPKFYVADIRALHPEKQFQNAGQARYAPSLSAAGK